MLAKHGQVDERDLFGLAALLATISGSVRMFHPAKASYLNHFKISSAIS
jgi:hypothetical protein